MTNVPVSRRPLRILPGLVIAIALVLVRYVIPTVLPDAEIAGLPVPMLGILGGVAGGLAIAIWWLFLSRAPWADRIGILAFAITAIVVTRLIVHESIAGGQMGMMLWIYGIPVLGLAVVAGAALGQHFSASTRRGVMAAAIVIACATFTLLRTDGITGDGISQLKWRWTPTAEQRLLAASATKTAPAPVTPATPPAPGTPVAPAPDAPGAPGAPGTPDAPDAPGAAGAAGAPSALNAPSAPNAPNAPSAPSAPGARGEWPAFRGPDRDSVVRGLRINPDWSASPPVELWRRPIGPGWSSVAVSGDLIYTQEQRGEEEIVACYRLSTGEPVWRHSDPVRFWESNGGAGPRGTPTAHNGRVYAFGATGVLNALDARTGARIWSRNVGTDAGVAIPDWGFASSPLVIDEIVIVAASGRLVAYDAHTGHLRWLGPPGGSGYSSPHLATIDGVPQVLLLRGSRTISVSPADGALLWEHVWQPGVGIVQPSVIGDDVLITVGDAMGGVGMRRIALSRSEGGWHSEERWTTRGLKPYFNDFVVHNGHAFGFDGSILSAIDLEDGARKWKGGRYGNGQMVLLAEQNLLLVLSEDGELALVSATPDKFTEVARAPALNAKTWNHPVLVGDVLLVRNGEEIAAFRLALER